MNTSEDENTLFIMRSLDTYKRYSEPMQCTGLCDKNGKLIFEGDIVKINDKSIAYIEFQRGIFGCQFDKKAKIVPRFLGVGAYESYELEVIGNIYENPELLEDK